MKRDRSTLLIALVVAVLVAAGCWIALSRDSTPTVTTPEAMPAQPDPAALAAGDTPPPDPERVAADVPTPQVPDGPSPEKPSPEQLWGRVVNAATGAPIPGADVRLLHRDADEFWNLDLDYGAQIDELARTTSDARGRFRFAVDRGRAHRVQAHAAGFAGAPAIDCVGGSEVVVRLGRGALVEGSVREKDTGKPLADVSIRIAVRGESMELATGHTDEQGTFRFESVPAARVYVQARPLLHDMTWIRADLEEGGHLRVDIEVTAGRVVRGRVVDAVMETPIAGAEISDSWTFRRHGVTDGDGRFALGGVGQSGTEQLHVRARGYASGSARPPDRDGEEIEFRLARGATVTGRLVEPGGWPARAVYAAVAASYVAGLGHGHQSTDWIRADVASNGRFEARGLRPDQHYWLYVRGAHYGARVYALPRPLQNDERTDVGDIVLCEPGGAEGRVVDGAGAPIAGVEVSIRGHNADAETLLEPHRSVGTRVTQFESRSVVADARGQFRFGGLSAGAYTLHTRHRDQQEDTSRPIDVIDGEILTDLVLTLPTGAAIEGVVRRADGHPLGTLAGRLRLHAHTHRGSSASAAVAPDGTFRFANLSEASYALWSRPPAGWTLMPRDGVAAGTSDLILQLEPAATIAGRVLDPESKPVARATLSVWHDGVETPSPVYSAAADGSFAIEVPPGFVGRVHAAHPGQWLMQATQENVTAGQTGIELKIQLPKALRNR